MMEKKEKGGNSTVVSIFITVVLSLASVALFSYAGYTSFFAEEVGPVSILHAVTPQPSLDIYYHDPPQSIHAIVRPVTARSALPPIEPRPIVILPIEPVIANPSPFLQAESVALLETSANSESYAILPAPSQVQPIASSANILLHSDPSGPEAFGSGDELLDHIFQVRINRYMSCGQNVRALRSNFVPTNEPFDEMIGRISTLTENNPSFQLGLPPTAFYMGSTFGGDTNIADVTNEVLLNPHNNDVRVESSYISMIPILEGGFTESLQNMPNNLGIIATRNPDVSGHFEFYQQLLEHKVRRVFCMEDTAYFTHFYGSKPSGFRITVTPYPGIPRQLLIEATGGLFGSMEVIHIVELNQIDWRPVSFGVDTITVENIRDAVNLMIAQTEDLSFSQMEFILVHCLYSRNRSALLVNAFKIRKYFDFFASTQAAALNALSNENTLIRFVNGVVADGRLQRGHYLFQQSSYDHLLAYTRYLVRTMRM